MDFGEVVLRVGDGGRVEGFVVGEGDLWCFCFDGCVWFELVWDGG